MLYKNNSLIIRIIKERRLTVFCVDCAYISESNILELVKESILFQAITEGFVTDDTATLDATHFEAKDQAPPKEERPKTEPKKRGRKSKEEREQWLIEKAENEANLPLFEKKIRTVERFFKPTSF